VGEPGCARAVLETIPPVMYFIRQEMRSHRRADLTVPQLRALVFIRRYPDSCLKMVAENVGLSLPAMSRLVEHLVRQKLVRRRADASDRRHLCLSVTARGRATHEAALRAAEAGLTEALANLNPADHAQIATGLRLLRGVFEPWPPVRSPGTPCAKPRRPGSPGTLTPV
jgi:DNA-binding MarR family transcriptional regulator